MIQANAGNEAWNLKISDPNREGKFLSVPIYYGDWVPVRILLKLFTLVIYVGANVTKLFTAVSYDFS